MKFAVTTTRKPVKREPLVPDAKPGVIDYHMMRERQIVCEACPELIPGTCRCSVFGCITLARLRVKPICKKWKS